MKKRVCSRAGCHRLVPFGINNYYCHEHQEPVRWGYKNKQPNMDYGTNWHTIRKVILQRDNYRCVNCGYHGTHVDHIIPYRQGGDHSYSNLQTLCRSCHSKKTSQEIHQRETRPYVDPPGYTHRSE